MMEAPNLSRESTKAMQGSNKKPDTTASIFYFDAFLRKIEINTKPSEPEEEGAILNEDQTAPEAETNQLRIQTPLVNCLS